MGGSLCGPRERLLIFTSAAGPVLQAYPGWVRRLRWAKIEKWPPGSPAGGMGLLTLTGAQVDGRGSLCGPRVGSEVVG